MKVQDWIELLKKYDNKKEVFFELCDMGDLDYLGETFEFGRVKEDEDSITVTLVVDP
ncbi:hypothetical protein HS141_16180 [Cetobacterium somerae]|uniref:hypothetical protein n=1 Tax=Cetobacterium somerae TaxID=188913 RepID=UPI00211F3F83|nr:hypothetical protein [Cetobacterium somerae]MCQ9628457.1 hypothetical protein [Cetobacterium somerae]